MPVLLIKSATLVTLTNEAKVDVLVEGGVIMKIAHHDSPDYALPSVPDDPVHEVIEADGLLLFPGLIDCHVHFREPGLEHKGTMKMEAAAALAGGVTTVCDMPNTNPPTVTVMALADKVRRAEEIEGVDIRFFFGATQDIHVAALRELLTGGNAELERLKARCCGVKVYFDHSTGDQGAALSVIEEVFRACADHDVPLVAHCEDPQLNAEAAARYADDASIHPTIARHSFMRPPESEAKAIETAIGLARKYGTRLHVAHLSTKEGIELVWQAKEEGLRVTCEVAPHHLFLTVDDYKTLGTLAKMNPPVRTAEHQKALWDGIIDGTIDCIGTDHAPHTLEEKTEGDPLTRPSGVPGVETMMPLLMTVVNGSDPHPDERSMKYELRSMDIVRLCFENPNQIFGLGKQGVVEGAPADLVLVDPKKAWTIRASKLHSKCQWTPYEGWEVTGYIVRVI